MARRKTKLTCEVKARVDQALYDQVLARAEGTTVAPVVRRALRVYLALLAVIEEPTA